MQKEETKERERIQKEEDLVRFMTDECLKTFENLTFDQFSSMKSKIESLENGCEKAYSDKAKCLVKNVALRTELNGLKDEFSLMESEIESLEKLKGQHSMELNGLKG